MQVLPKHGLTKMGAYCTYIAMSHSDIINLWPSLSAFAQDIGVPYVTAKAMRRRGSIPAPYWIRTVSRARERDIEGVTAERLAELVAVVPEAAE